MNDETGVAGPNLSANRVLVVDACLPLRLRCAAQDGRAEPVHRDGRSVLFTARPTWERSCVALGQSRANDSAEVGVDPLW